MAFALRHEQLREIMLEMISKLPPGARVPSVSKLKRDHGVSQSTVEKVLGYLKENGYVESAPRRGTTVSDRNAGAVAAKSLKRVELLHFGSIPTTHTFHSEFIDAVTASLGEKGAWLRVGTLPLDSGEKEVADYLDGREFDGLIISNLYRSGIFEAVRRRGIPCVLMFPNTRFELPNSVLVDNRKIARLWVTHLVDLGHERIAYLHSAQEEFYHRDVNQRLMFFYEEMSRAGLRADPDMNIYAGFSKSEGYEAAGKLLTSGKKFTAVICGDGNASGVYEAFHEKGLRIGRDVSVMGVDDSSWAAHMHPPLTTVRVPRKRLAKLALDRLAEMLQLKSAAMSFDKILVDTEWVSRKSTGMLKKGES